MTSRVLCPMDPVDPRMATRITGSAQDADQRVGEGKREHEGIEPVQDPPVAGKEASRSP